MKHKLLAIAASLCASAAMAAPTITTVDLGTLTLGTPTGNLFFRGPGEFLDLYKFIVPEASIGSASVVPTNLAPFYGIDFSSASLGFGGIALLDATGTTILVSDLDASDGLNLSGPLGAGTYNLGVLGTATGSQGGAYAGLIYLTSAVPEPGQYGMLLAGLGALGLLARRRRQA